MKNFIQKIVGVILCFGFVACSGTTGGSALPQSSLPPAQACSSGGGCITITGADARGYVTVTGSAGAVPNAAIVLVSVAGSISFNFNSIAGALMSEAHADTLMCSSSLNICSEDIEDSSCQKSAESDGSFIAFIKAEDGQMVSVSYLDPDDHCSESAAFEQTIEGTSLRLNQRAYSMSNNGHAEAYVFGEDENGSDVINVLELDKDGIGKVAVKSSIDLLGYVTGTPRQILSMENSQKLLVLTDEQTSLVIYDAGTEDIVIENLVLTGETKSVFKYAAVQRNFYVPSSATCSLDAGHTVDRVLLSHGDDAQFIADINNGGDITPIEIVNFTKDGITSPTTTVEAITYNLDSFIPGGDALSGAKLIGVEDIFVTKTNNKAYFIGRFQLLDSSEQLILIQIPFDESRLCETPPSVVSLFTYPDIIFIPLPQEIQTVGSFLELGVTDVMMLRDPTTSGKFCVIDFSNRSSTLVDSPTTDIMAGSYILPLSFESTENLEYIELTGASYLDSYLLHNKVSVTQEAKTAYLGLSLVEVDMLLPLSLTEYGSSDDLFGWQNTFDTSARLMILDDGLPDDYYTTLRMIGMDEIE